MFLRVFLAILQVFSNGFTNLLVVLLGVRVSDFRVPVWMQLLVCVFDWGSVMVFYLEWELLCWFYKGLPDFDMVLQSGDLMI